MAAVEITHTDLEFTQLRACSADLLDIGDFDLTDGHSRALVANADGLDRQTQCEWVHTIMLRFLIGRNSLPARRLENRRNIGLEEGPNLTEADVAR